MGGLGGSWVALLRDEVEHVLVLPLDVPEMVGLPLAALGAERALELGLLPALPEEVPLHRVLPDVRPRAVGAGEETVDPSRATPPRLLPQGLLQGKVGCCDETLSVIIPSVCKMSRLA